MPMEIGSAQVKREAELAPFAGEIFFQLLNVRPQCVWRFLKLRRFFAALASDCKSRGLGRIVCWPGRRVSNSRATNPEWRRP